MPLEANPDVLNSFAQKLGAVNIGDTDCDNGGVWYSFQDVYGLDEELLAMVPQPVLAVILLYPLTEASETARLEGGYHYGVEQRVILYNVSCMSMMQSWQRQSKMQWLLVVLCIT